MKSACNIPLILVYHLIYSLSVSITRCQKYLSYWKQYCIVRLNMETNVWFRMHTYTFAWWHSITISFGFHSVNCGTDNADYFFLTVRLHTSSRVAFHGLSMVIFSPSWGYIRKLNISLSTLIRNSWLLLLEQIDGPRS